MNWNTLFNIFPYAVLAVAVFGTVSVYRSRRYGISARSGGFLENRKLWGSVPWHYGIITVLAGHVIGVVAPSFVLSLTGNLTVLAALETLAFSGGLLCLFGLGALAVRKLSDRYALSQTRTGDWLVLILLVFQVLTGLYISAFHKWGINWYASNASVYVLSVLKLSPQGDVITALPIAVRLHVLNMFLIIAALPFTRLIHVFAVPLKYPFRPHIIFRWNTKEDL
ncbi:respiratory nitrate reductase subunit gamma [Geovibrio thiophilus]|nr:respiratory nitrate reductase subunit gamma [Geovibrio thiophilus]